jgi:hypothetical protein
MVTRLFLENSILSKLNKKGEAFASPFTNNRDLTFSYKFFNYCFVKLINSSSIVMPLALEMMKLFLTIPNGTSAK